MIMYLLLRTLLFKSFIIIFCCFMSHQTEDFAAANEDGATGKKKRKKKKKGKGGVEGAEAESEEPVNPPEPPRFEVNIYIFYSFRKCTI